MRCIKGTIAMRGNNLVGISGLAITHTIKVKTGPI